MGVHGTTVAFTQWPGAVEDFPEFGLMIGGRGANHRASDELVYVKIEDPEHPLTRIFNPSGFEYRDELFRVHDPYSRTRLRILMSMDTNKFDPNAGQPRGNCFRADNDYALAWIRQYGRGRTFYCTIAHNPYVFWDPQLLKFYLGAVQFALGDLKAGTTPSAFLNPTMHAMEKLDWQLAQYETSNASLFDSIDRAATAKVRFVEVNSDQIIGPDVEKKFNVQLSSEDQRRIRFKLDASAVRIVNYHVGKLPEVGMENIFSFARKMGIENIILNDLPGDYSRIEQNAEKYEMNVMIKNVDSLSRVEQILNSLQGRSNRLGVCVSMAKTLQAGDDPISIIGKLKGRLLAVDLSPILDQAKTEKPNHWSTMEQVLNSIRRQGIKVKQFKFSTGTPALESSTNAVDWFYGHGLKLIQN